MLFFRHCGSALSISLDLLNAIFALEKYELIITPSPLDKLFKEMLTHDECLLELSVPSGLEVPMFIEEFGPLNIKMGEGKDA